ncbi:CarD family transcriptional regulator [Romboutsia sp. 1001216sp1]|uniref:CarD family transcriptional regulator n=2 Tax=Romboutsia TaxID=1501226 RepID=UPI0018A0F5F3|nr:MULTISPECIES: CarD family transcriptional regulator [unclassified Romboutsia]MDB8801070.1 CarD family transcriptional regulator [Romboutsia sp. 1001216sp1]MDB8812469.1 CarD family transcriptional regulator [Romboutsia sp. 1001216sp1]
MYKIGEFIIYSNCGLCEVEDIGPLNISGINNKKDYYTLKPIYENGKIFTPIDTDIFMRAISTYEEVQQLIEGISSMEEMDCNEKNVNLLQSKYKCFIKNYECVDLLAVILGVYKKKYNGKKLGQVDEKFMKLAQGLINDEFSIALGISREEVEKYIKEKVRDRQYNN